MKFTIYVQDACDYCKQLSTFPTLDVELVYINRDDYDGFKPANVPVMQHMGLQLEGPHHINDLLTTIEQAGQGVYKKK